MNLGLYPLTPQTVSFPQMQRPIPRNRLRDLRQRQRQSRVHRLPLHPRRHRDAKRHERHLVLGIPAHAPPVGEYDPRLRHHVVHGVAFRATLCPVFAGLVFDRAVEFGGVEGCGRD